MRFPPKSLMGVRFGFGVVLDDWMLTELPFLLLKKFVVVLTFDVFAEFIVIAF